MLIIPQLLWGQSSVEPLLKEGIQQLQQGFQTWNLDDMMSAKAVLERATAIEPGNADALYWNGYADYRLAIRMLYTSNEDGHKDKAEEYLDRGIKTLEEAVKADPAHSDALALLATLIGMSIQFNPISGMWKGPKSNGYFDDALRANSGNPRVYYLQAVSKMNTPSMFGGGADKALPLFEKAVQLFETESGKPIGAPTHASWGFDECCAFYGNALASTKDFEKAKKMYEKTLSMNAGHRIAKAGLKKLESELDPKDQK